MLIPLTCWNIIVFWACQMMMDLGHNENGFWSMRETQETTQEEEVAKAKCPSLLEQLWPKNGRLALASSPWSSRPSTDRREDRRGSQDRRMIDVLGADEAEMQDESLSVAAREAALANGWLVL
jgi:hypothetical protein